MIQLIIVNNNFQFICEISDNKASGNYIYGKTKLSPDQFLTSGCTRLISTYPYFRRNFVLNKVKSRLTAAGFLKLK